MMKLQTIREKLQSLAAECDRQLAITEDLGLPDDDAAVRLLCLIRDGADLHLNDLHKIDGRQ